MSKSRRIQNFRAFESYSVADSFYSTSLIILNNLRKKPHLVIQCNASVIHSMELFLNVIANLEGKSPLWGHDLLGLYQDISKESRQAIEQFYKSSIKDYNIKLQDDIFEKFGFCIHPILTSAENVFSSCSLKYNEMIYGGFPSHEIGNMPYILRKYIHSTGPYWLKSGFSPARQSGSIVKLSNGPLLFDHDFDQSFFYGVGINHLECQFLINSHIHLDTKIAICSIVFGLYALEIFIKILLSMEGISPPKIHDIYRLFDALTPGSKEWISKKYYSWGARRALETRAAINTPSVEVALHECRNATTSLRYGEAAPVRIGILPCIVRDRIKELAPPWLTKG